MQALQTQLPRVLAEREVTPLGSEQPISGNVQLICATQRDLREMVAQGEFRLDLSVLAFPQRDAGAAGAARPCRQGRTDRGPVEGLLREGDMPL